jgi:hypothetical protein
MGAADSLEPITKARLGARPKLTGDRPLRRPHSSSHPLCGGCLTTLNVLLVVGVFHDCVQVASALLSAVRLSR